MDMAFIFYQAIAKPKQLLTPFIFNAYYNSHEIALRLL
jgi:hypothetical protein